MINLGPKLAKVFEDVQKESGKTRKYYGDKLNISRSLLYQNISNLKKNVGSIAAIERLAEAIGVNFYLGIYKHKSFESIVVDRHLEGFEGGEIIVTFKPDGHQVIFKELGLSDDEYKERSKVIRQLEGV